MQGLDQIPGFRHRQFLNIPRNSSKSYYLRFYYGAPIDRHTVNVVDLFSFGPYPAARKHTSFSLRLNADILTLKPTYFIDGSLYALIEYYLIVHSR